MINFLFNIIFLDRIISSKIDALIRIYRSIYDNYQFLLILTSIWWMIYKVVRDRGRNFLLWWEFLSRFDYWIFLLGLKIASLFQQNNRIQNRLIKFQLKELSKNSRHPIQSKTHYPKIKLIMGFWMIKTTIKEMVLKFIF